MHGPGRLAAGEAARRAPGRRLPRFLLASRFLNLGLLALVAAGSAAWVALVVGYLQVAERDSSGIGGGFVLAVAMAGSAGSLPVALYSWAGLFQPHGARLHGLRVAQLLCALRLLLTSLAVGGFLVFAATTFV